ncbi:uncharacterized protein LOC128198593 [Bicyclus anynana]|uniref:Uncharacterized protein LOC128198593 n=1 Tax=Bicyclus anynana TaxID=110368 RepID=A0ABM3LNS0_BICAN|nr:uncharacterized protein LOC128198593 [Bicyclus anynana]
MLLECLLLALAALLLLVRLRPESQLALHRRLAVSFPCAPLLGHAYKFIGTHEGELIASVCCWRWRRCCCWCGCGRRVSWRCTAGSRSASPARRCWGTPTSSSALTKVNSLRVSAASAGGAAAAGAAAAGESAGAAPPARGQLPLRAAAGARLQVHRHSRR